MIDSILSATPADLARCFALPVLIGFVVFVAWLNQRIRWSGDVRRRSHLIDSSAYRPPEHAHLIDFGRSTLAAQADGSVLATCAYAGCPTIVRIGRDVITLTIGQEAERTT